MMGRSLCSARARFGRENLHGKQHREAVKRLRETVEDGDFAAVLGPRRVGKTSIINVFLNKYGSKYRYLYYDLEFGME